MKPSVRAFVAIACLGSVLSFPSRAERLAVPGEPAGAGWMLLGALAVAAVIARRRCQWANLRGSPAISPVISPTSDAPHEKPQEGRHDRLYESAHQSPRQSHGPYAPPASRDLRQPAPAVAATMAAATGKTGTARMVRPAKAAAAARPVLRLVRSD
jgi:hypothetical protein